MEGISILEIISGLTVILLSSAILSLFSRISKMEEMYAKQYTKIEVLETEKETIKLQSQKDTARIEADVKEIKSEVKEINKNIQTILQKI